MKTVKYSIMRNWETFWIQLICVWFKSYAILSCQYRSWNMFFNPLILTIMYTVKGDEDALHCKRQFNEKCVNLGAPDKKCVKVWYSILHVLGIYSHTYNIYRRWTINYSVYLSLTCNGVFFGFSGQEWRVSCEGQYSKLLLGCQLPAQSLA